MASSSGPLYAGSAADTGTNSLGANNNAWTTPSNATGAPDAAYAQNGTNGKSNGIKLTNFGFAVPATAIIDGIYVEFDRACNVGTVTTDAIELVKAGSLVSATKKTGTDTWPASEAFTSYGGSSDLWGSSWTYSDINNSGFGVVIYPTSGSAANAQLDAVRITVYWHTAPTKVPKRYIYQVYSSSGAYIGLLPNVLSDFQYSQEMNTAGAQISVDVGVSADTAALTVDTLTDESGNVLTDENSNLLTDEGQIPIVALGSSAQTALIKNGNKIKVFEYGYWHPNGVQVFSGDMENWAADFGGSGEDKITLICYSDGSDLANYLVRGNPYTYTLDQSNTSQNSSGTISQGNPLDPKSYTYFYYGQSWTANAANLAAISVYLNGSATVTISVYTDATLTTGLGSVTQSVAVTSATEVQFAFPTSITTVAGTSYFFTVTVQANQGITIYYSNANPYGSGSMYTINYPSSGSTYIASTGADLYFKTYSATGSTTGTFTSQDPTSGILDTILADYNARGGLVTYTSSTIQTTGLSLSYGFNTDTVLTAIKAVKSMSPNGFYWYVDVGSSVLTMKQTSTSADITLVRGQNLESIKVVASIENTKNTTYFTGGAVAGTNIYTMHSDATSIGLYGPRLNLLADARVTVLATAKQIAQVDVDTQKSEQFQTVVTIVDSTYLDTTTIKPGMVIGFAGFGTFVDSLLMQIVRLEYAPEEVRLTLGILPKRLLPEFDKLTRGLVALQTVANPSTPS